MKITLNKEDYNYLVGKLEEANEWGHKHKNLRQMDFIQDVTYEALVFLKEKEAECKLKEKEWEYADRIKDLR